MKQERWAQKFIFYHDATVEKQIAFAESHQSRRPPSLMARDQHNGGHQPPHEGRALTIGASRAAKRRGDSPG